MKIFPKEPNLQTKSLKEKSNSKSSGPSARKKIDLPEKKDVSPSEIREKLALRAEASEVAKNLAIKNNSQKFGDGFLSTNDFVLKSDIAKNDPSDTNTQEKLKAVISKGAFNFNPKERETLEKILADN